MVNDDKRIVAKFGTFCNTVRSYFFLEISKAILTYRAACFVHSLQALRWKPRCNPQSPLIISLDGDIWGCCQWITQACSMGCDICSIVNGRSQADVFLPAAFVCSQFLNVVAVTSLGPVNMQLDTGAHLHMSADVAMSNCRGRIRPGSTDATDATDATDDPEPSPRSRQFQTYLYTKIIRNGDSPGMHRLSRIIQVPEDTTLIHSHVEIQIILILSKIDDFAAPQATKPA